jgi:hypothetical protein
MKYIIICILLFILLVVTFSNKESFMQFEQITTVPISTFANKDIELTFVPISVTPNT